MHCFDVILLSKVISSIGPKISDADTEIFIMPTGPHIVRRTHIYVHMPILWSRQLVQDGKGGYCFCLATHSGFAHSASGHTDS